MITITTNYLLTLFSVLLKFTACQTCFFVKSGKVFRKCQHQKKSSRLCGCGFIISAQSIMRHSTLIADHMSCPDISLSNTGLLVDIIFRIQQYGINSGFLVSQLIMEGAICPHSAPPLPSNQTMSSKVQLPMTSRTEDYLISERRYSKISAT